MNTMKILLVLLLPLVAANSFKETQNFQYSRTGEGDEEKKGYYGSQTGNMGGNFEVSHNMDTLAQRQMKGLAMTVSSQLGRDPHAIGTGAVLDELGNVGSVYGSASARGSAVGGQSAEAAGIGAGRAASQLYGAEARRHGSTSNYGSRTSGQRVVASGYEDEARHGSVDSTQRASQSGYRQIAGRQGSAGAVGGRYNSDSRYRTSANDYEDHHGETGSFSGTDHQGGATYYVPVTGVRQVGLDSAAEGSQYSESGSRYHSGSTSTAYEQSHAFAEAERQRAAGGNVGHHIVVKPGGTVRLAVRPGPVVPLTIPITVTPGVKPVYVRQNVGYGTNAAHAQRVDSESQVRAEDDDQRRDYGSDTYAQTNGWGETINTDYRQSSNSRQENLGSRRSGVDYTPGLSVGPVTDMGAIARNRDKLLVGGLEVGSEGQGSTVYNSGSRVASTGRNHGASQTYAESQYRTDASRNRQVTGETYDAGTNVHGEGDSEGLGSQVYQVQTKPKSYQSSYSYEKSWEKQGTPYTIYPAGHTTPDSGSLTSHNLYGQNSETQNQDTSQREDHSSRYGGSSQRATSSSHNAGSEYGSSYDSSRASSGSASRTSSGGISGATSGASSGASSHLDRQSMDLAAMQQRLRDQMAAGMGKLGTELGTGNSKGYSAHYSYSAQRSYGGADNSHDQTPDPSGHSTGQRRYRRGAYDGRYASTGYYDKYYKPEVEYVEQPEDLGQQTENFHDGSIDQEEIVGKAITELAQKLKDIIDRIDRELPDDLGQQTQGFSEIYHDSPKVEVESMMYQNKHLEHEDLGQQTENLGNFYSPNARDSKLQVGNMGYGDVYLSEPEYLGQETQDYIPSASFYIPQNTRLHVGEVSNYGEHLGQETEDLGQQPQVFSQHSYTISPSTSNLQLGSGSQIYSQNDRNSKPQSVPSPIHPNADLGQQTQAFSESQNFYSPSSRNPKLQVGSTVHHDDHLGQETEDLGQQTQDFSVSQIFYSPSSRNPKLQVGSTVHHNEHLGQETEDLGQQPQDFSVSQNFYSPSSRNPKLQVGSTVHDDEQLGQETEDLGQQTQAFSERDNFYSPSSRNPKLQVGIMVHRNEHLGQETEDLGQQTDLSPKTEKRDKTQRNIEYDDDKYVELQIGSILQQNEFFGRQPGNLQQKDANKPSDIDITQTSGNYDSPVEPDVEDMKNLKDDLSSQNHRRGYVNAEYKPATDENRRSQNTFGETNKLQDKVPGKLNIYKEHPKDQTDEAIDSHLAEIMAALSNPSSNSGYHTESKMDDIQAKYTEVQGNYIHQHEPQPVHKEEATVDIGFDGLSESSLGQEQLQYSGWDQQTQVGKETQTEKEVYRGHVKPKPLTSHSFLTTTQEVQEASKEQEEKSFLDAFPDHLSKDSEKEEPRSFGTALDKGTNHQQVDSHVASGKSPETDDLDQEFDEGGQQTLETQWSPEQLPQATVDDNHNQQQSIKPAYNSQNTHNLLTLSVNTHSENVEDLHQTHQEPNFQVNEKVNTLKEKSTDLVKTVEEVPTTTEKLNFWNKIGSGIGKAKDKAKSWFG